MLSRFISKPSHFRLLTLISSKSQSHSNPYTFHSPLNPNSTPLLELSRFFSSNHNNNNNNNDQSTSSAWKFSRENDGKSEPFFTEDAGDLAGITDFDAGELKAEGRGGIENDAWTRQSGEHGSNLFDGIEAESVAKSGGGGGGGVDDWLTGEGEFKPWSLAEEEKAGGDVFDFGDGGVQEFGGVDGESVEEVDRREQMMKLEKEESALTAVIKGSNRAFGDLIAASGITDKMLDSLIALKDLDEVDGLPPLTVIEDMRYEKNTRKSTRADIERQKQEEVAKARVRQVDDKGRAYGTGRRKCSIARVFIQPGEGKFVVNDKEFDVYFPMLDHRAALLRPFAETKTLGLWDIDCTVKGGGVSGQVGAIRLGISRALQNWEPGLRPALRDAGFLTRDPRVVERKKPGKAKARKSFQWVKR